MKNIFKLLFLFAFLEIGFSQEAKLLKDINPGVNGSFNFLTDKPVLEFNGKLFFVANSADYGVELWVYDGQKTELFKDINPGKNSSDVNHLFVVGSKMLFGADDGINGYELWSTDGTPQGTSMVVDLNSGTKSGLSKCCSSYASRKYHVFKNELYFNVTIANSQYRLYKSDGTANGTKEVKKLSDNQITAAGFTEWNGQLYFHTDFGGFWKTDGTTEGTTLIKSKIGDANTESFEVNYITDMGAYMIMTEGYNQNIWKSNGTLEGTVKVKDMFYSQAQNNVGHYFFRYGNNAFFPGSNPAFNTEMWKTDGTSNGTVQVSEIETNPGNIAFYPKRRISFKDKIYYLGGKNGLGSQIYVTDGNTTQLMVDLKQKINGEVYFQTDLIADDNHIFFVAGKPFDRELWYSDGTPEGTYEIKISKNDESTPERLTIYKNELFFFASSDGVGQEPHVIDITKLKTNVKDLTNESTNIYPNPTFGEIIIDNDPYKIEIYDSMGKLEASYFHQNEINIGNLKSGIKLVKSYFKNNKISMQQIIKLN